MEVVSIILAAGKGKRMNSDLPKPMHKIAGKSLMNWLEDALDELKVSKKLYVFGHQSEKLIESTGKSIQRPKPAFFTDSSLDLTIVLSEDTNVDLTAQDITTTLDGNSVNAALKFEVFIFLFNTSKNLFPEYSILIKLSPIIPIMKGVKKLTLLGRKEIKFNLKKEFQIGLTWLRKCNFFTVRNVTPFFFSIKPIN